MHIHRFIMCGALSLIAACQTTATGPELDAADSAPPKRMVTQGLATKMVAETLFKCQNPNPKMNYRASPVWQITATDGTVITVPGPTALQRGNVPPNGDLYNECTKVLPRNSAEVSAANVPVIEVDSDRAVHWMSPSDATEGQVLALGTDAKLPHPGGAQMACVGGGILFVSANSTPDKLRALISIDGKDDALAGGAD